MDGWTLVFDLDGTLIDTAPDLAGAANHVVRSLGHAPVPVDELRPAISFGARNILKTALAKRGVNPDDPELDRLLEHYLVHYEANIAVESRPFETMVECLESCGAQGARLAVCTNKLEYLTRRLLSELKLDGMFGAITGRDTFAVCKPDPGHLLGAIEMAGGDPRRAIMVGDSEVDIATAKAARIPVVAVTFGYPATPVADLAPDVIIHHYRELPGAIASLVGSRTA